MREVESEIYLGSFPLLVPLLTAIQQVRYHLLDSIARVGFPQPLPYLTTSDCNGNLVTFLAQLFQLVCRSLCRHSPSLGYLDMQRVIWVEQGNRQFPKVLLQVPRVPRPIRGGKFVDSICQSVAVDNG